MAWVSWRWVCMSSASISAPWGRCPGVTGTCFGPEPEWLATGFGLGPELATGAGGLGLGPELAIGPGILGWGTELAFGPGIFGLGTEDWFALDMCLQDAPPRRRCQGRNTQSAEFAPR